MDPNMFKDLAKACLIAGVALGLAVAGGVWVAVHFVAPHLRVIIR